MVWRAPYFNLGRWWEIQRSVEDSLDEPFFLRFRASPPSELSLISYIDALRDKDFPPLFFLADPFEPGSPLDPSPDLMLHEPTASW